jgi:hypothetical protein
MLRICWVGTGASIGWWNGFGSEFRVDHQFTLGFAIRLADSMPPLLLIGASSVG